MLYQLRTKVENIDFVALVCTKHQDVFNLPDKLEDTELMKYYEQLKEKLILHQKKGRQASFTYTLPMISIGLESRHAGYLFSEWKTQSWMAYGKDKRILIDSPLDREIIPEGKDLLNGLRAERRIGIHPLIIVRLIEEHFSLQ